MRFEFQRNYLEKLYTSKQGEKKYPVGIVKSFFRVMAIIVAAPNIRDFYNLKSLRFEKLSGNRKHQRSMRLNEQWRLIIEIHEDEKGEYLRIIDIEDYH